MLRACSPTGGTSTLGHCRRQALNGHATKQVRHSQSPALSCLPEDTINSNHPDFWEIEFWTQNEWKIGPQLLPRATKEDA
jgi:hypothetical protein